MHELKVIAANEDEVQDIIKIGGRWDAEIFVGKINDQVIGYFWGQVGKGDTYYITDREMFLEYICTNEHSKGYGRGVLKAIFEQLPVDAIYGETNDENKPFWEKVGAILPNDYTCEDREMYEFTLQRNDFMKS